MRAPVVLPAARLRRLAIAAQGLAKPGAFGHGLRGTQRAIEHLGYVQIDTISVVERAHHHTLWTRVPDYHAGMLARLLRERRIFEYWSHAAAFLPIKDYRFALPRMLAIRSGNARHWFRDRDRAAERAIVDRIRAEGPLRTKDFADGQRGTTGWWDWKPEKMALEALYMEGTLMCVARDGFAKVYDLTERVLPAGVDTTPPTDAEYAAHLIGAALRSHAFAAEPEFSYQRKSIALRKAVRAHLDAAVSAGELVCAQCAGGKHRLYVSRAALDTRPRIIERVSLLSPFDNSLIQRDRMTRIHDWNYQIECYVPAAKRQFGYFCLPVLFGDRFVGRADCKAERKTGVFSVLQLHVEKTDIDMDAFAAALATALAAFVSFNGCTQLRVDHIQPKKYAATVRAALNAESSNT